MPKQIIRDVFEELVETGKKTGQQLGKLPGEMVEGAAQQTGLKPQTEEQVKGEAEIRRLKEEDEEKKGKAIAFFKKQLAEFQKPSPSALPHAEQERQKEQVKMVELQEKKGKKLPLPVTAVKRKGGLGTGEFGKRTGD